MLHDAVMSRNPQPGTPGSCSPADVEKINCEEQTSISDRRISDRLPFPAEMVLVWNYDLNTPLRYSVIDAGDGGYRIHTSLPVTAGTTGMVLRLLPGFGQSLDQPVMVAWVRPVEEAQGFDVGLRCF